MRVDILEVQPLAKRHQQKYQLNIDQTGLHAEDLGIDLIKLPVSALLRPFAAEHRADHVKFLNRILAV